MASTTNDSDALANTTYSRPPDSTNVTRIPNSEGLYGRAAYIVHIPHGARGGEQFPVTVGGQQLMVDCPPNARPGVPVRIIPPGPLGNVDLTDDARPLDMQSFEGVVPRGVQPGQPFALLMASGVRILVKCPPNAREGQTVRFNLPLNLTRNITEQASEFAKFKLAYDKDGWTRIIRASDMKFQWIRMDDGGNIDTNKRFNAKTAAYVRKLEFVEGRDPRMRKGHLSLVTANDPAAVVDSSIKGPNGRPDLVSHANIAAAQVMTFEDKAQWFQDTCAQLRAEWNNKGHMLMKVRREYLLGDSIAAVLSLSRKDLRRNWIFQFTGEAGIDAGGLAREWFQLVTERIFDPDMGLWKSSATNQMLMEINPACKLSCPEDHLLYFQFLGRVMGKALFDRQLVAGHMISTLYKHMCGWPCQFADLEQVDEEIYDNLKKLLDMDPSEVEYLCLDFTMTEEAMGVTQTVELVPGDADIDVTGDNLPEYMEAILQYKMVGRVKPQLCELLLGFYDVIPETILTIFDFQELELLMCGLPEIDLHDWRDNTEYSGTFRRLGPNNDVVHWFWEVVEEMDQEMRARLLQFVTGTAGVPSRGFAVLQGTGGNIQKFTVNGVEVPSCLCPRAHTCFNRIDLPMYDNKADLKQKLELAVTMVATGFDIA